MFRWLDGRHVVFGEVVSGFDVVEKISKTKTLAGDKPAEKIIIVKCGEINPVEPYHIEL